MLGAYHRRYVRSRDDQRCENATTKKTEEERRERRERKEERKRKRRQKEEERREKEEERREKRGHGRERTTDTAAEISLSLLLVSSCLLLPCVEAKKKRKKAETKREKRQEKPETEEATEMGDTTHTAGSLPTHAQTLRPRYLWGLQFWLYLWLRLSQPERETEAVRREARGKKRRTVTRERGRGKETASGREVNLSGLSL